MTDTKTEPSQLMDIGEVASHNIAQALGLAEAEVPKIKAAIKDEIGSMASHFSLAVRDVQDHYETAEQKLAVSAKIEIAKATTAFQFAKVHPVATSVAVLVGIVAGFVVGRFV